MPKKMRVVFALTVLVVIVLTVSCQLPGATKRSLSDCQKVENDVLKRFCIDIYYNDLAISTKNPELCKSIGDMFDTRDECFKEVAKLTNNPEVCKGIGEELGVNSCFEALAVATKNPSICRNVGCANCTYDKHLKQVCFEKVAESTNNPDICENNEDIDSKNFCFINVAVALKDISICEKVKSDGVWLISNCYTDVAVNTKNLEICEKIMYEPYRSECVAGVNKEQ